MSDIGYAVLNAVCLKKMATAPAVAAATGLGTTEVELALADLVEQQLLAELGGSFLPTDAAVPTLEALAAERYAPVRDDPQVAAAAERFEPLNSAFLGAMSSWQLVTIGDRQVANDHTDSDYDESVISRIDKLTERLRPVLAAFAEHDSRFGTYTARFDAAMDEVARGRTEFVSSPTIDSVHNVWFEFHEDLLRTLGRRREE